MFKPLYGANDDEWVQIVGRYMLNLGAVEIATRLLIARITGGDQDRIYNDALAARIAYLRKRFPRGNSERHAWAMNAMDVAKQHCNFRNIVAHSPLAIEGCADGTYTIHGILNITPQDPTNMGHIVSLEEMKRRVNESAAVAQALLEMQKDYPANSG